MHALHTLKVLQYYPPTRHSHFKFTILNYILLFLRFCDLTHDFVPTEAWAVHKQSSQRRVEVEYFTIALLYYETTACRRVFPGHFKVAQKIVNIARAEPSFTTKSCVQFMHEWMEIKSRFISKA